MVLFFLHAVALWSFLSFVLNWCESSRIEPHLQVIFGQTTAQAGREFEPIAFIQSNTNPKDEKQKGCRNWTNHLLLFWFTVLLPFALLILPYDAVMSQLQALLLYFPVSVLTSFGVFCHCI